MLTRKHFETIARRIKAQVEPLKAKGADQLHEDKTTLAALNNLACDLCFDFRHENPQFDEGKFIAACGF